MKSSIIAGVCLLALILSVAECNLGRGLDFHLSKKQTVECGDPTDPNTGIGRCTALANAGDAEAICNGGCIEVYKDFYNCLGISDNGLIDQLRESCRQFNSATATNAATTVGATNAATTAGATLISALTATVMAVAAAIN